MKKKNIKRRWIPVAMIVLLLGIIAIWFFIYRDELATQLASGYEVQGVDVSHYQGDIDWEILAGEDIDFAFIKATEGSGHTDSKFAEN